GKELPLRDRPPVSKRAIKSGSCEQNAEHEYRSCPPRGCKKASSNCSTQGRLLALSGRLRASVRCLLSKATRTFSGHCRKPRLTETDIARSLSARRGFFETT